MIIPTVSKRSDLITKICFNVERNIQCTYIHTYNILKSIFSTCCLYICSSNNYENVTRNHVLVKYALSWVIWYIFPFWFWPLFASETSWNHIYFQGCGTERQVTCFISSFYLLFPLLYVNNHKIHGRSESYYFASKLSF